MSKPGTCGDSGPKISVCLSFVRGRVALRLPFYHALLHLLVTYSRRTCTASAANLTVRGEQDGRRLACRMIEDCGIRQIAGYKTAV